MNESSGLVRLRGLLRDRDRLGEATQIIAAKDSVLAEFGRLFSPPRLDTLTANEFKAFLSFDNNQHWYGIQRQQNSITQDMELLRTVLRMLFEESLPIAERLDRVVNPEGANLVRGLGKAVITPLLMIRYPDRYGVWNSPSEEAMKDLDLWPDFPWGSSFGRKYAIVNGVLNGLAERLETDLWTLDGLWWAHIRPHAKTPTGSGSGSAYEPAVARNLERFLCQSCFSSKAVHLRSSTGRDVCTDCE